MGFAAKGISYMAFERARPLDEVCRMAREAGFDAVELRVLREGKLRPDSSPDECREVVETCRAAGVSIPSLTHDFGPQTPLITRDEAKRQASIEHYGRVLRVAQQLGVEAFLLVPGAVSAGDGVPYDEAYDLARDALKELAPVAEETGVTIAVENVWNKFLLSPLEFRGFLDEIGSPRVGCYFDVGNVLYSGYPEQWIRILGHRIARVHFKDYTSQKLGMDGFVGLLEGEVNYPAVMQALREIGYTGPVTAEFFSCEDDLPKIAAAMERIFAM